MDAMQKYAKSRGKRIIEVPIDDLSDSDEPSMPSKKLCKDNQESLEGVDVDVDQLFTPFDEEPQPSTSFDGLKVYCESASSRKPEVLGCGINIYSPSTFKVNPQAIHQVNPFIKVFVPKGYIIHLMDIPYLTCKGLKIMQQDFEGTADFFKLTLHYLNHTNSSINVMKGQCLTKIVLLKCENNVKVL